MTENNETFFFFLHILMRCVLVNAMVRLIWFPVTVTSWETADTEIEEVTMHA